MATTAATRLVLASSSLSAATKDWSILTSSTGRRSSEASEEYPVPKSSIEMRTPHERSETSSVAMRGRFSITIDSVSSSFRAEAGRPWASRERAT